MQGDEQRCRDAGMDGFLAKPYTLTALRATLARWFAVEPLAEPAGAPEPTPGPAPDPRPPAIDPGVIETLRELDETGSMALVREVLGAYLLSARDALARVQAAVAAGDARALGQIAHALKSSSANVGALALSNCWRELEACGREGRIGAAGALIDRTRAEHERALARLAEILEETA
jgi:HPt (histidine-containing phosphotransfer) domain-containing protein